MLGPVQSSNILGIGYEPGEQVLAVQFRSGDLYTYSGVPAEVYQDFLGAESKGKYFYRFIRPSYSWEKNPAQLAETVRLEVTVETTIETRVEAVEDTGAV
jgi:hypothetical protein